MVSLDILIGSFAKDPIYLGVVTLLNDINIDKIGLEELTVEYGTVGKNLC